MEMRQYPAALQRYLMTKSSVHSYAMRIYEVMSSFLDALQCRMRTLYIELICRISRRYARQRILRSRSPPP